MEKLNIQDWDAMTSTEQQEFISKSGESVLVTFETRDGNEYSTQIDLDFVPFFSKILWSGNGRNNRKYIVAQFQGRGYKATIQLAELVLLSHGKVAPKDHDVHHINGNRLDNRYANLGILHRSANAALKDSLISADDYLGVSRCGGGRIKARILEGGRRVYLGSAKDTPENRERLAHIYDEAWENKFGLPGPNFSTCENYPISRSEMILQGAC